MYKVFVNDKPIILTDKLQKTLDFPYCQYGELVLDEAVHKLQNENLNGIIFICKDLQESWSNFQSHFSKVVAAGGLVVNEQQEFLFIYRNDKWDLPKGGVEKGENIEEAATREVQEECGIHNVKLDRFLLTTYHIFYQDYEYKLKETHWYLMRSTPKEILIPQLEEGITEVIFKNYEQTQTALQNTYANIKLVFDAL